MRLNEIIVLRLDRILYAGIAEMDNLKLIFSPKETILYKELFNNWNFI